MKIDVLQDESNLSTSPDFASPAESEPQETSITFQKEPTIKVEEDELAPTSSGDTTIQMEEDF